MMRILVFLFLVFPLAGFGITAEEIIRAVDKNQVAASQTASAVMIIEKDGRRLVKQMKIWSLREGQKSFVEFTNPEDKGVKYLKLGSELWIYLPDADDVLKISGHMLRQGMMGSDLSYEDMLSDEDYRTRYTATLTGDTNVDGSPCYVVSMVARDTAVDLTYYRQDIVVNQEKMVPVELAMYAKSGRLLKKMTQSDIRKTGTRWTPYKTVISDARNVGSRTTFELQSVELDVPVPAGKFSRQNLKK